MRAPSAIWTPLHELASKRQRKLLKTVRDASWVKIEKTARETWNVHPGMRRRPVIRSPLIWMTWSGHLGAQGWLSAPANVTNRSISRIREVAQAVLFVPGWGACSRLVSLISLRRAARALVGASCSNSQAASLMTRSLRVATSLRLISSIAGLQPLCQLQPAKRRPHPTAQCASDYRNVSCDDR
jgi:hypothetical protein